MYDADRRSVIDEEEIGEELAGTLVTAMREMSESPVDSARAPFATITSRDAHETGMKYGPLQDGSPRVVVVTGASTGIGKEIARLLTSTGYLVFGSVRKEKDGLDLRQELGDRFSPLLFDVTNEQQVRNASQKVREALQGRTLFGLVNNAGVANAGAVLHQDLDNFRQNVDINLIGAFIVTQISSGAGKLGMPFCSGYCASKHGLEGFSQALRRELLLYGIDVIVIGYRKEVACGNAFQAQGEVRTPILDKAEQQGRLLLEKYEGTDYKGPLETLLKFIVEEGRAGVRPEKVASLVLNALTKRRPRTRYAIFNKRLVIWTIPRCLPDRWLDRLYGKTFSLLPPLPRLTHGGQHSKKQP